MFTFKTKKNHNRKWEQRPQLYRGRFFYVRQVAQVALVFFSVMALAALFLFFRQAEALKIHDVTITGNPAHVNQEGILRLSGIQKGENIFFVDLSKVQKNILRHPWVAAVQVRRDFPDQIQIHVIEHQVAAVLAAQELYLVDDQGMIFKKMEPGDAADFPVMTGLSRDWLEKFPHVMRGRVRACFETLTFLQGQEFYQSQDILEIHCDEVLGYTVFAGDDSLEVFYGKGDVALKQAKLEKFKLSKQYDERNLRRLDLDSKNRVIARTL
jgi:cell division protein FtsQ